LQKILSSAVVIMLLTSGVMADGYVKGSIYSSESDTTRTSNGTENGYQFSVGANGHLKATGNLFYGGEIGYSLQKSDLTSTDTKDMQVFGTQVHLGWTFFEDLDVYGILGYYVSSTEYRSNGNWYLNSDGEGPIFGLGADYAIWKHFSVGAEYTTTTYDLGWSSPSGSSYRTSETYTNISGNIKFRF